MYIYRFVQADCLNIHFIYHCSILAGFLPNSHDTVENGCGIPYMTCSDFGSRKFIHNSFTDLTFSGKYTLAIYLFLYLEFHNEFATTTNQLCYSKYVNEFLMTIVQSCCDYGICNVSFVLNISGYFDSHL